MRRYAVVGGEWPPLSKYCTSREAVFVCSGHICVISDSTDGNGDRFLTGYNDSMIGYEKNEFNILSLVSHLLLHRSS